jgi:hypothetical protein
MHYVCGAIQKGKSTEARLQKGGHRENHSSENPEERYTKTAYSQIKKTP